MTNPICHFNLVTILVVISTQFLWPVGNVFAIVGDEEISYSTITEMRHAHEELQKEKDDSEEEEKRVYLIQLVEEKIQKAKQGSEEEKVLSNELIRLRSESLIRKKNWRDRIRLTPFERIAFDSNVLNQKNAESDTIFHSGFGLQADLGAQRAALDLDYFGSYAAYVKHTDLNRFENQLGLNLRYPFSSKSNVTASYRLSSTGNQNSEIRSVLKRIRQDMGVTFNQRLSRKTGIRIGQTFSNVFFMSDKDKDESSSQYTISPEIDYFLSKKTSLFARYAYGIASGGRDNVNDSTAHELRGGIRGKVAPKTTVLLDLGYSRQNLDTLGGHTNAFVAEVVIITNMTRKSRLELLINRSFSKSTQTEGSHFFVTENYRLTGSTQFRRYLYGELLAGVRRNLFEKNGSISNTDRKDLTLELGSTLRYDFRKWLSLEFRYLFNIVDATEKNREFVKQLLSVAFNGKF